MNTHSSYIIIPTEPTAQKRPRFYKRKVIDLQAKEKKCLKIIVRAQWKNPPLKGPVEIEAVFYMPIPESWSKKKKKEAVGEPHCCKPDGDNLLKKVLDLMNGIVYNDDCQVYKMTGIKIYDNNPRTEIKVVCKELSQDKNSANGRLLKPLESKNQQDEKKLNGL